MDRAAPLILAIDTSAAHCAAAVVSGDVALASESEAMAKGQAERLFPLIEELLAHARRGWSDLDAIAVCTGPGNFTGIRIGVSAARGLALSLGRPAVGVSRLEALAEGCVSPVATAVEAPRGDVYAQAFGPGGAALTEPMTGAAEEIADRLAGAHPELVLGAGAGAMASLLGCAAGSEGDVPPPEAFARIAAHRLAAGGEIPRPAPLYIRPADAAPSSEAPPDLLP